MAAPTCAQGGVCAIGDTGPGGGKVFFVKSTGIFTKSRTVSSGCPMFCMTQTYTVTLTSAQQDALTFDYLEAAPTDSGSSLRWGSNGGITGGTSLLIGSGASNTANIIATFPSDTAADNAAYYADSYINNGKTDWFLPSYDELLLLMILSLESDSGGPNVGTYTSGHWASTSSDNTNARYSARTQLSGYVTKGSSANALAIRSFSASPTQQSSGDAEADEAKKEAERQAKIRAAREKLNKDLVAEAPINPIDLANAEAPLKSTDSLLLVFQELVAFRNNRTTPLSLEEQNAKKISTIYKYVQYEKIAGINNSMVYARDLVTFGVISKNTPMKTLATYQLMKLPTQDRDTITEVAQYFENSNRQIEIRKQHLATILAKIRGYSSQITH